MKTNFTIKLEKDKIVKIIPCASMCLQSQACHSLSRYSHVQCQFPCQLNLLLQESLYAPP